MEFLASSALGDDDIPLSCSLATTAAAAAAAAAADNKTCLDSEEKKSSVDLGEFFENKGGWSPKRDSKEQSPPRSRGNSEEQQLMSPLRRHAGLQPLSFSTTVTTEVAAARPMGRRDSELPSCEDADKTLKMEPGSVLAAKLEAKLEEKKQKKKRRLAEEHEADSETMASQAEVDAAFYRIVDGVCNDDLLQQLKGLTVKTTMGGGEQPRLSPRLKKLPPFTASSSSPKVDVDMDAWPFSPRKPKIRRSSDATSTSSTTPSSPAPPRSPAALKPLLKRSTEHLTPKEEHESWDNSSSSNTATATLSPHSPPPPRPPSQKRRTLRHCCALSPERGPAAFQRGTHDCSASPLELGCPLSPHRSLAQRPVRSVDSIAMRKLTFDDETSPPRPPVGLQKTTACSFGALFCN